MSDLEGDHDWTRNEAWPVVAAEARRSGIDPERARAQLALLYPPVLCRELLATKNADLLSPLYVPGIMPGVLETVLLGHDLADCPGWKHESGLVARLRNVDEFHEARFEAGMWATLRRAGVEVAYEPLADAGGKTADFVIVEDGVTVALEVKALNPSSLTKNVGAIEDAVTDAIRDLDCFGKKLTFRAATDLADEAGTCDTTSFGRRVSEVLDGLRAWAGAPDALAAGVHPIAALGEVLVETGPSATALEWNVTGLDEPGIGREVERALRLARRAGGQAAAHDVDVRAALVWTSAWRSPVVPSVVAVGERVRDHPELYRRLDHVLLLNSHRLAGPARTDVVAARLPWSRRDIQGMRWVEGLKCWRRLPF